MRQILALYVHGSRVRGLAGPSSDWDFLVVVRGDVPLEKHYQYAACRIDLTLLSKHSFVSEIRAHNLWRLACLYSPPAFILCLNESFSSVFSLNLEHLFHAAVYHSLLHYNKAARAFALAAAPAEGISAAKKKIFHALLLLSWAEDLARNGRVTDQEAANVHWRALQADVTALAWQSLHATFRGVLLQHLEKIASLCGRTIDSIPTHWCVAPPLVSTPAVLSPSYVTLASECVVAATAMKSGNIRSTSFALFTHHEYDELQQLGGGGVIYSTKEQRVVCAAIWQADAAIAQVPDALLCRMYYYDSQWKLACGLRPDPGSERDLLLSNDKTPALLFWCAYFRSNKALSTLDKSFSYCFAVKETQLRLLSFTNLETFERKEA